MYKFLPEICLRVHNEIHNIRKPCLVKCFKWLLKVIQGQRAGKGLAKGWQRAHFGFPTLEAKRAHPSTVVLCLVFTRQYTVKFFPSMIILETFSHHYQLPTFIL